MIETTSTGSLTESEAASRFARMLGGDADNIEEDPEDGQNVEDDAEDLEDGEGEEPEQESDDDDDSEGEPEADDDDDSEGQDQRPEQTYTVKVNGEELQVPLSELLSGYSRQADYTRKAMQLATVRKETEAEREALRSERVQLAQYLEGELVRMQRQAPQEPDWARLEVEDPIEFSRQWAIHQRRQQQYAETQHRLRATQEQARRDSEAQLKTVLEQEQAKLTQAIPDWQDPKKASRDRTGMREYALSVGFTDEELSGIYDHRTMLVLHKAYQYDQMQRRQPAVRQETQQRRVTPPVASATAVSPGKNQPTKTAIRQLARTGSVKDAAAVFQRML